MNESDNFLLKQKKIHHNLVFDRSEYLENFTKHREKFSKVLEELKNTHPVSETTYPPGLDKVISSNRERVMQTLNEFNSQTIKQDYYIQCNHNPYRERFYEVVDKLNEFSISKKEFFEIFSTKASQLTSIFETPIPDERCLCIVESNLGPFLEKILRGREMYALEKFCLLNEHIGSVLLQQPIFTALGFSAFFSTLNYLKRDGNLNRVISKLILQRQDLLTYKIYSNMGAYSNYAQRG